MQCRTPCTADVVRVDSSAAPAPAETPPFIGKDGVPPSQCLIVRNLHEDAHEESLRFEFSSHGEVTEVKVVRDKVTLKPRGFGFVTFATVSGWAGGRVAG